MPRFETPGAAGVSSSPRSPAEAYLLQNMVRTDDGVWRPRPGFRCVRDFAQSQPFDSLGTPMTVDGGDICHINGWVGDLVFGCNRIQFSSPVSPTPVGFWAYRESNDTVYPLTTNIPSYTGPGDGTLYTWFRSVQATMSLVDGTRRDYMTFLFGERGYVYHARPDTFVADQPSPSFQAAWLDVHAGYVVACGGQQLAGSTDKKLRWSVRFDPTSWNSVDETTVDHSIGEPIAIVPWQHGISFILGRRGVGEMDGLSSSGFVFKPTLDLPAAPAPNTVCKVGESVFFLTPGPNLVQMGLGGPAIVSGPVDRELRALTTLRDLRCWHDSYHNLYCVSNPVNGRTYLHSPDERRWVGHWSRGDGLMFLGEARPEMATDVDGNRVDYQPPFAAIYVAAGSLLGRWDPTLSVDQVSTDPDDPAHEPIVCAVETSPAEEPRFSNLKQLESVTINGAGEWTLILRHRKEQDGSWTDTTLQTVTAPARVNGPLTTYRQSVIRAESTDSAARFRSFEVNEVDRGGY